MTADRDLVEDGDGLRFDPPLDLRPGEKITWTETFTTQPVKPTGIPLPPIEVIRSHWVPPRTAYLLTDDRCVVLLGVIKLPWWRRAWSKLVSVIEAVQV